MAYHNNIVSLLIEANAKATKILNQDMLPVGKEVFKQHIQKDIYDTYAPKKGAWVNGSTYARRYDLLNIGTINLGNNTIMLTNFSSPSSPIIKGWSFKHNGAGSFLKLLENGNMGIWKRGFPRPAVSNTQKDFDSNEKLNNAIQKGIQREFR